MNTATDKSICEVRYRHLAELAAHQEADNGQIDEMFALAEHIHHLDTLQR